MKFKIQDKIVVLDEVFLMQDRIIIIDFGAPDVVDMAGIITQFDIKCQIKTNNITADWIKKQQDIKGIILSGGPSSMRFASAPVVDIEIFNLSIPILGICYGCEMMNTLLGGKMMKREILEKGVYKLELTEQSTLLKDTPINQNVYMDHIDQVDLMPIGFQSLASTQSCPVAAMQNLERNLFAVQFHPEKGKTTYGQQILRNFVFEICGCTPKQKN